MKGTVLTPGRGIEQAGADSAIDRSPVLIVLPPTFFVDPSYPSLRPPRGNVHPLTLLAAVLEPPNRVSLRFHLPPAFNIRHTVSGAGAVLPQPKHQLFKLCRGGGEIWIRRSSPWVSWGIDGAVNGSNRRGGFIHPAAFRVRRFNLCTDKQRGARDEHHSHFLSILP